MPGNPKGGGQPGNSNAARGTRWREALRKALAKMDGGDKGKALEKVAVALIGAAQEGDISAIKELGDRIDGKAVAMVVQDVTVHDSPGVDAPPLATNYQEWITRHVDAATRPPDRRH